MVNSLFSKKDIFLRKKHDPCFEAWIKDLPENFNGVVCDTIDRDSEGNSGGKPRWVKVRESVNGKLSENSRIAIYKEPDYDEVEGPYAEKMWSILGKLVLPNCVVPDIDIISDPREKMVPGVLSYCIADKEKEDMIEIRNILRWNGISEKDMLQNDDRLYTKELLNHIKAYIKDDEKYNEIEGEIVKVILLDCVTNSLDRHPDNWCVIFNHKTGKYRVGLYDNTVSFVNMISPRPGVVVDGNWGRIFIKVENENGRTSDKGNEVIKYIHQEYPEYFNEFTESFSSKVEEFCYLIGEDKYREVTKSMRKRNSYLKSLDRDERDFD